MEVLGAAAADSEEVHFLAARAGTLQVRIIGHGHVAAADADEPAFSGSLEHGPEFAAQDTIGAAYDLF